MAGTDYTTATPAEVLQWLRDGLFTFSTDNEERTVILNRHGQELTQRLQKRKQSERGDARVDLRYNNKRRSINVSNLVWMFNCDCVIPDKFEIHHMDEDPWNNTFDNLLCVHEQDHRKIHSLSVVKEDDDYVPF